jgi:hypothetical protein
MFRSERVVNFIRRKVVNLPRRMPIIYTGRGWSIYTGGDWLFIPAFPINIIVSFEFINKSIPCFL